MRIETYREFCKQYDRTFLSILEGGHAVCKDGEWSADVISPGYSRLYYILSGDPYILVNGEEIELLPGRCYLIPAGLSFHYDCRTGMEQVYFHLNLRNESGWDLLRSCPGVLSCDLEGEPPEFPSAAVLRSEGGNGGGNGGWNGGVNVNGSGISGMFLTESRIKQTLAQLFLENAYEPEDKMLSPVIRSAVSQIRQHPSIQLTLEQMAVCTFTSPSTLAKRFRKEMGMTLGSYIDEAVFFEAEQLLRKSDLSMREISERLGFGDQFYFSRRFKEKYGVAPLKYRKRLMI